MKYFFVCYIEYSSAFLALYYKMPQKDNILPAFQYFISNMQIFNRLIL